MKNYKLLLLCNFLSFIFFQLSAFAQVNVNVIVSAPYAQRVVDYKNQMVIMLTNTSNTRQNVQLRGIITGDNGIIVQSRPNYKSTSAIVLAPGQTLNLTGENMDYFFDFRDLQYSGITQDEAVRIGGLPEGRYQLCIRAFDYDNNQPLSSDEPLGCSNIFTISSLEPPVILSPMADEEIAMDAGQIFTIRWHTPVSAPRGIKYRIRMVEVLGNSNPNDAIMTATQPYFFEKEVMTNIYIYNPADPQLTPGRKYALMVEAFDPFNNAVFRNQGRSEVVGFIYSPSKIITIELPVITENTSEKSTIITSVIVGKAVWSFKKAEEEMPPTVDNAMFQMIDQGQTVTNFLGSMTSNAASESNAISANAHIQSYRTAIDPNLRVSSSISTGSSNFTQNIESNLVIPEESVLSAVIGDGKVIEKKDLKIASENGNTIHPLYRAKVMVKGIKAEAMNLKVNTRISKDLPPKGKQVSLSTQLGMVTPMPPQKKSEKQGAFIHDFAASYNMPATGESSYDLLASGTTNKEGNFKINFIDPKFRNITQYSKIQVTIEHEDFETYSKVISVASHADSAVLDLGEMQLLAKTYRFTPYVSGFTAGAKIDLWCPSSAFNQNPHYNMMVSESSDKEKKTIAGKQYIKLATLSKGETINKLFYQKGTHDNLIVQVNASQKEEYTSYFGVRPVRYSKKNLFSNAQVAVDESNMVLSIKTNYTLKNQLPYISGKVEIFVEDRNNSANSATIFDKGAVVTITYEKSKVVEEYKETVLDGNDTPTGSKNSSGNVNTSSATANRLVSAKVKTAMSTVAAKQNISAAKPASTSISSSSAGTFKNVADFKSTAVSNIAISQQLLSLYKFTTTTDENGEYRIDKLPILEEGAYFTVSVKSTDGMDSSQELKIPLKRGDHEVVNFQFKPEVFTISGIAVDENGNPLTDALLLWKSGGMPVEADQNGLFVTSNYKDDSLTIKNQGFIDKTIFVKIDKPDTGKKSKGKQKSKITNTSASATLNKSVTINNWATTLLQQPSIKASATSSSPVTAFTFGYAVSNTSMQTGISAEFTTMYSDLFTKNQKPVGFKDLGKVGYLPKGFAKINFIVKDLVTKEPIPNAVVTIDEVFDTITNAAGEVIYKSGGGGFTYQIKGPALSAYIAQIGEVNASATDGKITNVEVLLEKGVKISGKVTSKGENLDSAEIFVDGKEFISTRSKSDGTYELYIPKGENILKATKSRYIGSKISKNFTQDLVHNFELEDGGGRNVSQLLGFEIELESYTKDGTVEKWTGSFINLKPNTIFSISANTKLKFSNVKVSFDAAGNAIVQGNKVNVDASQLSMKLYNYVPVIIKGSPQITVMEKDGVGIIGGKVQINLDQITTGGGIIFDSSLEPLLIPSNGTIEDEIAIFSSNNSFPDIQFAFSYERADLKKAADKAVKEFEVLLQNAKGEGKSSLEAKLSELKAAASSSSTYSTGTSAIPATVQQYASVELYGFKSMLNLSQSRIDQSGLNMAGFVISPDMPIMSAMYFDLEKLKVGTDFSVKEVSVKSDLQRKFSIASWSAEINSVILSLRGFKVGGKIEVEVPKSPKTSLVFSNLAFGNSGLYGGSFTFPTEGLSIFNVINLKSGSTPLTFGEIGNTGVYKLGGSAKFSFDKMFTDTIQVPYFQIQTNGKFGVTVPVNKSLNISFAKFALHSINFNTDTSIPQIDVEGQFSVDVKLLKLSAGAIHFKTSGITVDKIGLGLDIPGTKVDGFVDIKEHGFAGGGSLGIVGTPIKASIDFHYFKRPNQGVDLGASFLAGVKIPIGPVIITKVGGGFTYRSNPEHFSVTITGGASITGFEEAISLDPISITVESGPKIVGEASLRVATFSVAKASLIIDIPNEYFAVGIVADIEPLPDIAQAHIQGDLIISTKSSDTYFFLGCGMNVNLLGLIRSEGVFAVGVGVKNAKSRPTISYYMKDAPDDYLSNGTFSGLYVKGLSEMGVRKENAPSLNLVIVSGKLWLYTRSEFSLIANIQNNNFRISASTAFEGGIQACVVGFCAEASAKACASIEGGFHNELGWNFAASASGEAILALGSQCGCNDICVGLFYAGGKICVGAGARINYASRRGGLTELSMFIGDRSTCYY